ncbi:hypothetical protein ACFV98_15360 [Streptomyces violascens]|uniref:hypothetical protein n=1 Tax=Streptomyces violascens TaxID=67381 RepID=UPI00365749A6
MERPVLLECDRAPAELPSLLSSLISRKGVLSGKTLLVVLHLLPRLRTRRVSLGFDSLTLSGELDPTAGDSLLDLLSL